jgi:hypothetical protein
MYISPERKVSTVPGTGVQYIPWHNEPFVDFVVDNFLPPTGGIADLGGGGLRFAMPVALKKRSVTVVDLDEAGLDIENIVKRSNEFGKLHIELSEIIPYITIKNDNIFSFLEKDNETYQLITAFRLMHFFSPTEIDTFFSMVSTKLSPNGTFAFSGVTSYNTTDKETPNDIFINSTACDQDNPLYRKFNESPEAVAIRNSQNLAEYIHLIDKKFIDHLADKYHYIVAAADVPSTKIVAGYVLQKN